MAQIPLTSWASSVILKFHRENSGGGSEKELEKLLTEYGNYDKLRKLPLKNNNKENKKVVDKRKRMW